VIEQVAAAEAAARAALLKRAIDAEKVLDRPRNQNVHLLKERSRNRRNETCPGEKKSQAWPTRVGRRWVELLLST
jgi:hypothetical protein